jgi:uncharacterized membrane protein YfcA
MWHFIWLVPLGFIVGAYGTLIGAGGGFVLMPILLLLYPTETPELLTSISLAVVFFNALSGSVAYAQMRRIDYKSGIMFSAATIPGAILGALATGYIPRRLFDGIFGILLIGVAAFLWFRERPGDSESSGKGTHDLTRFLVEADGTSHVYSYNPYLGVGLSIFVGFLSSLLGIGGGIIHVPALVYLLNFPVHIATATSHFVLAVMALTGTAVHVATGVFSHGVRRTIALAVGVLLGAQLGARLSNRVQGGWIIRGLAIALGFIGVRVLLQAFSL